MADQDLTWDLLGLPSKAVGALREALASANVEAPAWLVQLVIILVAIVLIYVFLRLVRSNNNPSARAFNGTGLVVAVAIVIGVVWTWGDHWINPLIGQVVGELKGVPPSRVQIELLDYRDRDIGVADKVSGSDQFVASYEPFFADPPLAIRATAEGCGEARLSLTRRHLQFGTPVTLFLNCDGARQ